MTCREQRWRARSQTPPSPPGVATPAPPVPPTAVVVTLVAPSGTVTEYRPEGVEENSVTGLAVAVPAERALTARPTPSRAMSSLTSWQGVSPGHRVGLVQRCGQDGGASPYSVARLSTYCSLAHADPRRSGQGGFRDARPCESQHHPAVYAHVLPGMGEEAGAALSASLLA